MCSGKMFPASGNTTSITHEETAIAGGPIAGATRRGAPRTARSRRRPPSRSTRCGTPMGTLLVMKACSMSISTIATTGGVPSGVSKNASGTPSSSAVPSVRHRLCQVRRPQIARVVHVHAPAHEPEAHQRAVAGHHARDRREVVVELGERRPRTRARSAPPWPQGSSRSRTQSRQCHPVVLGAGGEEDRLVEYAQQRHEHHQRQESPRRRHRREQRAQRRRRPARRRAPRRAHRACARR